MKQVVVTGIGTDIGKTFVSAVLVAGLNARYWKPIQAGLEPITDADQIRNWLQLSDDRIIPSVYELTRAESPHNAAKADGIAIVPESLRLPEIQGNLVIEGAGGVMVPLSENLLFIDMLLVWKLPVVLVIDGYLGCINHTLLTWEVLKTRGITIEGLIFNRITNYSATDYISKHTGEKVLGYIEHYNNRGMDQFQQFHDCFNFHIHF